MPHIDYLPRFRRQCAADDGTYDEAFLIDKMEAAFAAVIKMTGRTEEELVTIGGGKLPPEIIEAVMMLGADTYSQLEGVAGIQMHEVPMGIRTLVAPYRRLTKKQ